MFDKFTRRKKKSLGVNLGRYESLCFFYLPCNLDDEVSYGYCDH